MLPVPHSEENQLKNARALDGSVVLRMPQEVNDTRQDSQGEQGASHPYPSSEAALPES